MKTNYFKYLILRKYYFSHYYQKLKPYYDYTYSGYAKLAPNTVIIGTLTTNEQNISTDLELVRTIVGNLNRKFR